MLDAAERAEDPIFGIFPHGADISALLADRLYYAAEENGCAVYLYLDELPHMDENGQLLPEVVDVLRYLATEHPEVVLATGHGTVKEIDALLQKAFDLGVKKVLVNHPHFHIGVSLDDVHTNATVDDMVRWADMGAYIELNAVVFDEIFPAPEHLPISLAREMIDRVGAERMILDSDLGQSKWPVPVKGMLAFIAGLIELCGVTEEQIVTMFHRNPAKLIDMPVVD